MVDCIVKLTIKVKGAKTDNLSIQHNTHCDYSEKIKNDSCQQSTGNSNAPKYILFGAGMQQV